MGRYTESNKYNATPRKVFDKAMDRQDTRLSRHKEDHRRDIAALTARVINLEEMLTQFTTFKKHDCTDPTCKYCTDENDEIPPEDLRDS